MFELIRKYGKKYQLVSVLAASAKLIEVLFDLLIPLVIRHMIDAGVATQDVAVVSRDALLLVAFTVVGYLSTLICQILAARISQGFGCDLREQAFENCLSMEVDELSSLGVSSALNRLTSDINQVQLAVALAIRQLVRWPFIALGSVIAAAYVDLKLSLILLASLGLISLVMYAVVRESVPLFGKVQEHLDKLIQVARDLIEGARTIRSFGRESYEEELFSEAARDLSETNRAVASLSAALGPVTTLILNVGIAVILALGAGRVNGGELSQGSLVSLVSYMSNTLLAVIFVANLFAIFTKAQASAKRILELLDGSRKSAEEMQVAKEQLTETVAHTNEGDVAAKLTHTIDKASNTSEGLAYVSDEVLVFNDVSFSYPDAKAPALKNINFSLKAGESLGIMGGTGSGKTSLLSLIVGLRKPTSGFVSLFGKDHDEFSTDDLQGLISYVPQKSALMEGSLRENLSWRDEHASDSELEEALTLAQAADFVDALEDGLESHVEAGGKNFSGGQLQRLAIARALVGNPRLLLLDDPTASLDAISAAKVREALTAQGGLTTVTVSESVAALKDCSKILLLDQGALVAAGSHDELLASSELYREFFDSQMALKGLEALS